jgi:hypothetical protein
MSSLKEVCITAAKKVFDSGTEAEKHAQSYIELAIVRFAKNVEETPPHVLATIAESAAWFIYDKKLDQETSTPINARRERIAEHLRTKFPLYANSDTTIDDTLKSVSGQ